MNDDRGSKFTVEKQNNVSLHSHFDSIKSRLWTYCSKIRLGGNSKVLMREFRWVRFVLC